MQLARDLLPLRQCVIPSGDAVPVFARQGLLDWLSRPERFQITSHGTGGEILAASEGALADARAVLRQAYGELVGFGQVAVDCRTDPATGASLVPIMFLRIDAPRRLAAWLVELLRRRAAQVQDVEPQRERVVVRAEIALAQLLGLEQEVLAASDGAAQVLSWLLRYAPDPRGSARRGMPHEAVLRRVEAR